MMEKIVSEYEQTRLNRIKENQKMLEELFPEGPTTLTLPSRSSKSQKSPRCRKRSDDDVSVESDNVSEVEDGLSLKKKPRYVIK